MERITAEEFNAANKLRYEKTGRPQRPEAMALLALAPGEGLKLPCHWAHNAVSRMCYGGAWARKVAKGGTFQVKTVCQDEALYIMRVS